MTAFSHKFGHVLHCKKKPGIDALDEVLGLMMLLKTPESAPKLTQIVAAVTNRQGRTCTAAR